LETLGALEAEFSAFQQPLTILKQGAIRRTNIIS
jgi:hypothetical protein